VNRRSTKFAEIAIISKLLTNPQNEIFHARRGRDLFATSAPWPIGPNDAIETLASGAKHPTLDCSQSHTKLLRDRTLRASASHGSNDLLSTRFTPVFCPRRSPG
jgi:hypothetical protein